MLALKHNVIISSRTLKRLMKKGQLYRRRKHSDVLDVTLFILQECQGSGQLHGYRWMHSKCIESGLVVSQDTVRLLQGIVDSPGVDARRKRRLRRRTYLCPGPNSVWHIDGYDKLKPFGICIHGAIDGFSRHMIWIHAWNTNNNPRIVAGYFIKAAKQKNGIPERIRSDCGTENGLIEKIQVLLRSDHDDRYAGDRSYIYGTSTLNQRIEWWWGLLRKEAIQFWMELFKSLQHDDYFTGDFLDKSLIQFCFMDMIQVSYFEDCQGAYVLYIQLYNSRPQSTIHIRH